MATDSNVDSEELELNCLGGIVEYLNLYGYLSDIECRRIVHTSEVIDRRAAIFQIIVTKHLKVAVDILKIFSTNIHPLLNPAILKIIFSELSASDVKNSSLVCRKWNLVYGSSLFSKHNNQDKIPNLDQLFEILFLNQADLITKPDCRDTIEMQASIFEHMLSLNLKNEKTVMQISRNIENVQKIAKRESQDDEFNHKVMNALQNDAVLNHLFGFLSLKEIKACRIVCRRWNSVADPFLRNLCRIRFTPSFRPRSFVSTFQYILPNLPFTNFKIRANMHDISELTSFFSKHGNNIHSLILYNANLKTGIAKCLHQLPNLTELHFTGTPITGFQNETELMVPWDKLHGIKTLTLGNVVINVPITGNDNRRITPSKIILESCKFYLDGNSLTEIILNDYVDFGAAREIKIYRANSSIRMIFDWTSDVINAGNITFDKINFVNWEASTAKVNYFKLTNCDFVERTQMHITQLFFQAGTIDLFALPHSIEKLSLRSHAIIELSQPISLPKLRFLSLFRKERAFEVISHFSNCPNLVDMEWLGGPTLDVSCVPESVKRMKFNHSLEFFDNNETDDVRPPDLDFLMLDGKNSASLLLQAIGKMRPEILVARFDGTYGDMMSHELLVNCLRNDRRLKKFVVQFCTNVVQNLPSERFISPFYEFNNDQEIATTITREDFKSYEMLVGMEQP